MRYERLKDIVRLAVRLQAASGGLTLEDIQAEFSVSRRTAERMRDAVGEFRKATDARAAVPTLVVVAVPVDGLDDGRPSRGG